MDWRTLTVAALCSILGQASGNYTTASVDDVKALKTKLFTTNKYDVTIRPVYKQIDVVDVNVSFHLFAINALNEKAESLQTTGYLWMDWRDEFLTWNASDYGNLTHFFIPQNDVWKPDITLINSVGQYKPMGHESLNVYVTSSGVVNWIPFQVLESTCSIDITSFPFDTQTCDLAFVAWSYSIHDVRLAGSGIDGFNLSQFRGSSAWNIIEADWYTVEDYETETTIVFTLKMKRKPLYNLLTLVFPVIMLAILNLFVFTLPSDGGEKAGYAVTVFLAFAVFLTIMEASFPQNSETLGYFAIYVVIQTTQSTVITLISLVMVRCASFDESKPIPGCVLALVRCAECKTIRGKLKKGNTRVCAKNTIEVVKSISLDDVGPDDEQNSVDIAGDDGEPDETYTWKYVMNTLDMVFFVFFMLVFLVSTIVGYLMAHFYIPLKYEG